MRFRPVLITLAALGPIVVGLSMYLPRDQERPRETPGPAASGTQVPHVQGKDSSPSTVIYLKGRNMRRAMIGGEDSLLIDIGTDDVTPAPQGGLLALVEAHRTDPDDDFIEDPRIVVFDPVARERVDLGPGFVPHWNPSGSTLAFHRPTEPRSCFAESCSGDSEIVIAEISGESHTVIPRGTWTILGWLGDLLLVADVSAPDDVIAVTGRGEQTLFPIAPSSIWGGSPDGRWLITSDATGTQMLHISDGQITGPPKPLDIQGRRLGDGAWSPDSKTVAAVALGRSLTGEDNVVVTFSAAAPEVSPLKGSTGAIGQLVWAPDSSSVAFAALAPGMALEARLCPIVVGDCDIVMEWEKNVTLLELE